MYIMKIQNIKLTICDKVVILVLLYDNANDIIKVRGVQHTLSNYKKNKVRYSNE